MDYDDYDDDRSEGSDKFQIMEEESTPHFELLSIAHELDSGEIQSFDMQNDVMAILSSRDGKIIIRDLKESHSSVIHVIPTAYKIFLHPSGNHLIVTCMNGDVHYLSTKHKKCVNHFALFAALGEARNTSAAVAVGESIAWDYTDDMTSSSTSTGSMIIGTRSGGLLFEVGFKATGMVAQVTMNRHLFQLPKDSHGSCISGIAVETVCDQKLIIVTTQTRLYRFKGEIMTMDKIFQGYKGRQCPFTEIPATIDNPARGTLSVFRPTLSSEAQSLTWACPLGITHSVFHRSTDDMDEVDEFEDEDEGNELLQNVSHVQLGRQHQQSSFLPEKTASQAIHTAFHMFLLYEDRMLILNHPAGMTWRPVSGKELRDSDLNDRLRFDPFRYKKVRLVGMIRDVAMRKVYVFSGSSIWEVTVEREHRTQWRLFLERAIDAREDSNMRKRYFTAAHNLTRDDPARRDMINFVRGTYLLELREYGPATASFAQCNRFEEIYCLLSSLRKPVVLLDFLEKRYNYLIQYRKRGTMQSQLACLTCLLTNLKLESLSRSEGTTKFDSKTEELCSFINHAVAVSRTSFEDRPFYNVVGRLLTSHGRINVMLHYAQLLDHVHFTINFYISQERYKEACKVLTDRCSKDKETVWYDFAPLIIRHCPIQLITGMMKAVIKDGDSTYQLLDPERLMPTFVNYQPSMNEEVTNKEHQVIIYLERCIDRYYCGSAMVHNYYVTLLAEYDPIRLTDYIESDNASYIPEFALRRCLERYRFQQCVTLYKKLELYDDAISIALDSSEMDDYGYWSGLETAKEMLRDRPFGVDSVTHKRLWLLVAVRVIEKAKDGAREALKIVEDSNGVLKLEDVLGRITDNTVIMSFKDAVCRSLDEYTNSISVLKGCQRDASTMSDTIKKDISQMRHRFGYVTSTQRCGLCNRGLLHSAQSFLVYPSCRHVFHEQCVIDKLRDVGGLQAFQADVDIPHGYLDGVFNVGDLASVECVFCGECSILESSIPFFEYGEDNSWEI